MRQRDRRDFSIHLLIYLAIAAVAAIAALLAIDLLRARGIQAGYGFLSQTAGFEIGFKLIAFDATSSYGRAFVVSLLNTLLVSVLAIAFATLLGLAVAIARLAPIPALRAAGVAYVEIIRNVPLLLQLLALYFLLLHALPPPRQSIALGGIVLINNRGISLPAPVLTADMAILAIGGVALLAGSLVAAWRRMTRASAWLFAGALAFVVAPLTQSAWELPAIRGFNVRGGIVFVPELAVLVVALAIYSAAFIAEALRSGFLSVPAGQWEAGAALGLGRRWTLRFVILPQAVRACVPPLVNQYVNVVKASSLAAAVGFPDLMQVFGKTTLNQTGQAVEVMAMTMAVYLAITLTISGAAHWYQRRTGKGAVT